MTASTISKRKSLRPGWVMLDVVAGLMLMLATLALLGTAMTRTSISAGRLADDRAAARLAELSLLKLSANPGTKIAQDVEIISLDTAAPAGHQWVTATATVGKRHVSVTGLIPTTRPSTPPASEVAP